MWIVSRLVLAVCSDIGVHLLQRRAGVPGRPAGSFPTVGYTSHFLSAWNQWDAMWFSRLARYGYHGPNPAGMSYFRAGEAAFLPGMPWAIRGVHLGVGSYVAAALVVSFAAGAVAATSLWLLAHDRYGRAAADRAVVLFVVFPYAVFLFAGYSEPLLLALILPAWVLADRGRWTAACALTAVAMFVRVTAVPFALALLVKFLLSPSRSADPAVRRRQAASFVLPVAGFVGLQVWSRETFGNWHAYTDAQKAVWGRSFAWPWTTFSTSLSQAHHWFGVGSVWTERIEIATVIVGVLLTGLLASRRQWPEATYVGASTALVATSGYYAAGIRTSLTWFPLFLALAAIDSRHLQRLLILAAAPLMLTVTLLFNAGVFVG